MTPAPLTAAAFTSPKTVRVQELARWERWVVVYARVALGIGLLLGLWPRSVALGSAVLLALFGVAMAISFGIKAPLDYSVFSASAGALLLALHQIRESRTAS